MKLVRYVYDLIDGGRLRDESHRDIGIQSRLFLFEFEVFNKVIHK